MQDINFMSLFEFERLSEYLVDRQKGSMGKHHKLNATQKRMIEEAKNGNGKG